jgi:proteasome lid subunit RPN8/RPN11
MIEIEKSAWASMVLHAERSYPDECCGAMIGRIQGDKKTVTKAVALDNSFSGEKGARYELRPQDLLHADQAARSSGLDLIGIFHSHPNCDAYFSETDLKNSCPWYSFVVLSIRDGKFDHANSFLPDPDQTHADREELIWQKS